MSICLRFDVGFRNIETEPSGIEREEEAEFERMILDVSGLGNGAAQCSFDAVLISWSGSTPIRYGFLRAARSAASPARLLAS